MTETLLKDAIKDAFDDGGEPSLVLVGSFNKQIFSGFAGRAVTQTMVDNKTVLGAASIYTSDFGDLKVVPNRTQRGRDTYVIDTTKVAVAGCACSSRRNWAASAMRPPAISSPNTRWRCGHPDAHALIADLATS
jgi:hypothetical protein